MTNNFDKSLQDKIKKEEEARTSKVKDLEDENTKLKKQVEELETQLKESEVLKPAVGAPPGAVSP